MPGLFDSPPSVFYELVNFERHRLFWTSDQVREFARTHIGKTEPNQFTASDWINLTYALRRCD